MFETALISTPSPSFNARRAVQVAAASSPPKGRCVLLFSRHLCTQRLPPPRSARLDTTEPVATALRARRAPTRTSRAQVGAAAPRIMMPATHVLILSDASNALGQQYPATYVCTTPPQRTAHIIVSKIRNLNPNPQTLTPNPNPKPQTSNPQHTNFNPKPPNPNPQPHTLKP